MKTAAGILLLLAAMFNLFGALGYLGGGAMTAGMSSVTRYAVEEAARDGRAEMSDADRAAMNETMDQATGWGGLLLGMGALLLVSVCVLVAGAVFLFKGTQWKFIIGAGVLSIAVEILGIGMTVFGPTNLVGIVGGVLAIIAAVQIRQAVSPAAA